MVKILLVGSIALLIAGIGMAFGPLKSDPRKLKPGQSLEEAEKNIRRMGRLVIVAMLGMIVFITKYFFG